MKTNLLNLLLVSIMCLALSNAVSAQKPDIQKIYSVLPVEFFSLKIFDDADPLFNLTKRNEYLNEEFFDAKDGLYKGSMWSYEDYYGSEEPDSNFVIEPNYWIGINKQLDFAYFKFDYEGNSNKLDMIIIEKDSNFYLAIIEQYRPGMGVPAKVETNFFPIKNSEVVNEKHAIEIPKLDLSSFYSKKDLKKVNTKMLKGVKIPYLIEVEIIEGEANLIITSDLEELVWRMTEVVEFESAELYGHDRYLEAQRILGLEGLAEPKPVYVLLKDLMK